MQGLYVTRQLPVIWRQMPKLFILQFTEIKIQSFYLFLQTSTKKAKLNMHL